MNTLRLFLCCGTLLCTVLAYGQAPPVLWEKTYDSYMHFHCFEPSATGYTGIANIDGKPNFCVINKDGTFEKTVISEDPNMIFFYAGLLTESGWLYLTPTSNIALYDMDTKQFLSKKFPAGFTPNLLVREHGEYLVSGTSEVSGKFYPAFCKINEKLEIGAITTLSFVSAPGPAYQVNARILPAKGDGYILFFSNFEKKIAAVYRIQEDGTLVWNYPMNGEQVKSTGVVSPHDGSILVSTFGDDENLIQLSADGDLIEKIVSDDVVVSITALPEGGFAISAQDGSPKGFFSKLFVLNEKMIKMWDMKFGVPDSADVLFNVYYNSGQYLVISGIGETLSSREKSRVRLVGYSTAIASSTSEQYSVYPNPSHGPVTFAGFKGDGFANVYSIDGAEKAHLPLIQGNGTLPALSPGMYIYRTESGHTGKLIFK